MSISSTGWKRPVSRRDFLRGGAAAALGGAVSVAAASCGQSPAASASGPVTLQMWVWEEVSQWEQVVKNSGLHQKYPNVKLSFTALNSSTLQQKLISALSSGVSSGLPDICRISADWYDQIVSTKAVIETTSKLSGVRKDIFPSTYQVLDVRGKTYGVPDDIGADQMAYRVDLFEKAGLPTDPDQVADLWPTWDDYIAVGKRLESKLGVSLTNIDPTQGGGYDTLELQGSTGEFDKDGNVIFDDAYHVSAAETLKRIFDSGLVTTYSTAGSGSPQYWNGIAKGEFATMIWPNWEDFEVLDFAPSSKDQWRVTYLPRVNANSRRVASDDGCLQVIPSGIASDRQRIALEVSLYMRTTTKALLSHMHTFSGAFVSYIPALDKMTSTPSPVLKGQSTYNWFLDTVNKEGMYPHYRTSVHFSDAGTALANGIDAILTKNGGVAATLHKAAQQIRSLQKSTGQK